MSSKMEWCKHGQIGSECKECGEKMECPSCGQIEFVFNEQVNGIDMFKCGNCSTEASF